VFREWQQRIVNYVVEHCANLALNSSSENNQWHVSHYFNRQVIIPSSFIYTPYNYCSNHNYVITKKKCDNLSILYFACIDLNPKFIRLFQLFTTFIWCIFGFSTISKFIIHKSSSKPSFFIDQTIMNMSVMLFVIKICINSVNSF
jgi:hypothetical protein